jgi:hypothetical protein
MVERFAQQRNAPDGLFGGWKIQGRKPDGCGVMQLLLAANLALNFMLAAYMLPVDTMSICEVYAA